MKLNVKLFARARDIAGAESITLDVPDAAKVADLRTALAARFPEMEPIVSSLLVAIGIEYADDNADLTDAHEIACFPPVSGG